MAKVQYNITTEGKAISAMVADIKTRSSLLRSNVHVAACSIIAHAVKHGDATLATHMPDIVAEALGEGWRLNALRQWFADLGCFVWVAKEGDKPAQFKIDKDKRKVMKAELDQSESAFLERLIKLKTFYEYKPEAPYQEFDFPAMLAALIKKANTRKAKATKGDKFDGMEEAAELLVKLTEDKATKVVKAKKAKAA